MNTFLTAGKPAALGIFAKLQWRRENFWRLEIDLVMINKTLEEPTILHIEIPFSNPFPILLGPRQDGLQGRH